MNLLSSLVVYRKSCRSASPAYTASSSVQYLMTFVGWVVHQIVFSVALNSDSETLAALQTLKAVFRTQRRVLTPLRFRCSPLVVPGMRFVAI